MARTVDTTLDLPTRTSKARTEIADDNAKGSGLEPMAAAINTLLEAYKGSLVADAGDAILTSNSNALYYRVPLQGEPSSDDDVDVWAYGRGNGGNATLRVRSSAGASSSTVSASTSIAWWNLGQVAVADNGSGEGYEDLTIDCTAGTPDLDAVSIFYERAQTALPAVASAASEYPDGTLPLERSAYAGERPFTATRGVDMTRNLRKLYARRWPIVATAYQTGWGSTGAKRYFAGEIPTTQTPQTLTATIWVRVTGTGVSGAGLGALTLTDEDSGSGDSAVVTNGVTGWQKLEVTRTSLPETSQRVTPVRFSITTGNYTSVTSICGWWEGVAYG